MSFSYIVKGASGATGDLGVVILVDEEGNVLDVVSEVPLSSGSSETFTVTASSVPVDSKVILLFSRNGAGAGGIDITNISAAFED